MITQSNFLSVLSRAQPFLTIFAFALLNGFSHISSAQSSVNNRLQNQQCYVLVADRVFDGFMLLENPIEQAMQSRH